MERKTHSDEGTTVGFPSCLKVKHSHEPFLNQNGIRKDAIPINLDGKSLSILRPQKSPPLGLSDTFGHILLTDRCTK